MASVLFPPVQAIKNAVTAGAIHRTGSRPCVRTDAIANRTAVYFRLSSAT